MVILEKKKCCD